MANNKIPIPKLLFDFMKDIMPEERFYHFLPDEKMCFITSQLPIDSGIVLVQDGKNIEVLSVERDGEIFVTNDHPIIFKGWVVSLITVVK